MDWTIFFRPFFGPFFGPLVLREGREAECYYSGKGERRTITTQGRVGGGCNSKRYWLMELLLDRTNYFNRFFD